MSQSFIYTYDYRSDFGDLVVGTYQDKLVVCDWKFRKMRKMVDDRLCRFFETEMKTVSTPQADAIIWQTIQQLESYFSSQRNDFDIPLQLAGTPFQMSVWKALLNIPYGKTLSYLELSKQLGDEKAIRAVASANGANAISIIVPCHRVIASNGDLTGYAGGISVKKKLLQLEGKQNASKQLELL
jgi:methylated-DNA-[protein]-cysteine S-methyltransferase